MGSSPFLDRTQMAHFDWIRFFNAYGVPYVTKGANISRGDVGLKCPWCGDDDPSEHMGVSLAGSGFSCWRNSRHGGTNPKRLVMALLRCSEQEAARIVGTEATPPLSSDSEFVMQVMGALGKKSVLSSPAAAPLRPMPEMRPLEDRGMGRLFVSYLVAQRRYSRPQALALAVRYGLLYAIDGPFRYRVIIPVADENGLATWTGRTIQSNEIVRYKTLTTDLEKAQLQKTPVARRSIKHLLWNAPELLKDRVSDTLIVCEGPLDALRVDFFGREVGVRATCLFGKSISQEQLTLMDGVASVFRRKFLVLDQDARIGQVSMMDGLRYLGFKTAVMPEGVKDPAELTRAQITEWLTYYRPSAL